MAYVTNHATKRTKERLGLSKKLATKNAERALAEGLRHRDTGGSLFRYIESLYWKNRTANNVRIYCNYVYIFHDSLLITVYPLPQRYRKTVDKLRKEKNIENEESE